MGHNYETRISAAHYKEDGYITLVDFTSNVGMLRLHFSTGKVKEYRFAFEREIK